jgi:hypothetical protein
MLNLEISYLSQTKATYMLNLEPFMHKTTISSRKIQRISCNLTSIICWAGISCNTAIMLKRVDYNVGGEISIFLCISYLILIFKKNMQYATFITRILISRAKPTSSGTYLTFRIKPTLWSPFSRIFKKNMQLSTFSSRYL